MTIRIILQRYQPVFIEWGEQDLNHDLQYPGLLSWSLHPNGSFLKDLPLGHVPPKQKIYWFLVQIAGISPDHPTIL